MQPDLHTPAFRFEPSRLIKDRVGLVEPASQAHGARKLRKCLGPQVVTQGAIQQLAESGLTCVGVIEIPKRIDSRRIRLAIHLNII
jgi:hypothetical protein